MRAPVFIAITLASTLASVSADATLRTTRPDTSSHAPSKCDTTCNTGGAPLCGTDGETYANYCQYTIASCKNASLAIAYTAACVGDSQNNGGDGGGDGGDGGGGDDGAPPTSKPTRKPPAVTTKAPASKAQQQDQESATFVLPIVDNSKAEQDNKPQKEAQAPDYCAVKCTSTEDFVCGSDDQTYTNECLLLAAKCTNAKLNVASKGKCLADKCARFCTREYEPLCGSDGVTYGNACTFAEANCLADGKLKVIIESECPTPKPKAQDEDKKAGKCGDSVQCDAMEVCIDDKAHDRQFCAELCEDQDMDKDSKKKLCEKHELCVLQQVACLVAPCPKLPGCIKV
ncbi:hypothetical protein Gpo141_00004958 [Globisporangium polare]